MKKDIKITVNPFNKEVVIRDNLQSIDHVFSSLDEWQAFEFHDCIVDMHFYYENKLGISLYPVIDGEVDTETSLPFELDIVLTEQGIQDAIF